MPPLTLRFDGLYRDYSSTAGVPAGAGLMCYGWVADGDDGRPLGQGYGAVARRQHASSNAAEYLALIEGLDALLDLRLERESITVMGDARSVIEQLSGLSAVNAASVQPLYQRAARLARRFSQLIWTWQPRQMNHRADALTRRALRQVHRNRSGLLETLHSLQAVPADRSFRRQALTVFDLSVYYPPRPAAGRTLRGTA